MNVDLLILRTEIEKEIRKITNREELLRSQLTNLQSVVSFLHDNHRISEKCQVTKRGVLTSASDSNGDSRTLGTGIRVCPRCDVKVLPTKDGRCPSCQTDFSAC